MTRTEVLQRQVKQEFPKTYAICRFQTTRNERGGVVGRTQLTSKRYSSIYMGGGGQKTTEHNDQQRLAIKQSVNTSSGTTQREEEAPKASLHSSWQTVHICASFEAVYSIFCCDACVQYCAVLSPLEATNAQMTDHWKVQDVVTRHASAVVLHTCPNETSILSKASVMFLVQQHQVDQTRHVTSHSRPHILTDVWVTATTIVAIPVGTTPMHEDKRNDGR